MSHADDRTAVALADPLGLDRLQTIARINMDRARDSEERPFWKQIAAVAAIVMMLTPLASLVWSHGNRAQTLLMG
ncbi:hypothetical protein [Lysobacter sp. CA196]|uniref:hypothetical protein n=1 Tax=Lysobacter sp. CA196 TaxID=3455606 RepID=UPI003F8D8858